MREFDCTIFRLGGFHIAEDFLDVIGKQMGGSGFSEISSDTPSYGPMKVKGTVQFEFF